MADAVMAALPADRAIMVAAVADWRVEPSPTKLKKGDGPPKLNFAADPRHPRRSLGARAAAAPVVGFAAETDDVVDNAIAKRTAKAPTGSSPTTCPATSWAARNRVHLVTADGIEDWPEDEGGGARGLVERIRPANCGHDEGCRSR